jgi:hypothetical protein
MGADLWGAHQSALSGAELNAVDAAHLLLGRSQWHSQPVALNGRPEMNRCCPLPYPERNITRTAAFN